jgi:hypothetical protein
MSMEGCVGGCVGHTPQWYVNGGENGVGEAHALVK